MQGRGDEDGGETDVRREEAVLPQDAQDGGEQRAERRVSTGMDSRVGRLAARGGVVLGASAEIRGGYGQRRLAEGVREVRRFRLSRSAERGGVQGGREGRRRVVHHPEGADPALRQSLRVL